MTQPDSKSRTPPQPAANRGLVLALIAVSSLAWLSAVALIYMSYRTEQESEYLAIITAHPLSVHLDFPQRPPPLSRNTMSVIMLGATLLFAAPLVYARKRVSIAGLLTIVLLAGAMGAAPQFLNSAPRDGTIRIVESNRKGADQLTPAEYQVMLLRMQPEYALPTLPRDLAIDLRLTRDLLARVDVDDDIVGTESGIVASFHIDFKPGITRDQAATLFHFYSAMVHTMATAFYDDKLPANSPLQIDSPEPSGVIIGSRFGAYEKMWRRELNAIAPQPTPAPQLEPPPPPAPDPAPKPPTKEF